MTLRAVPKMGEIEAAKTGVRLFVDVRWSDACRAPLDCGSSCVLAKGHDNSHECAGDHPGEPGTCPA